MAICKSEVTSSIPNQLLHATVGALDAVQSTQLLQTATLGCHAD